MNNSNAIPEAEEPLDLTISNVDAEDPRFIPMLNDLQANILKSHGRRFSHHLFLRLEPDKVKLAKHWLSGFAKSRITSALRFERERKAFKNDGTDGGAVFTISISATGYAILGIEKLPVEQIPKDLDIVKDDPAFPSGAKGKKIDLPTGEVWTSAEKLGDGVPATDWEVPFRGNVDILIMVADSHPDKAHELSKVVAKEVSAFSLVLLNQKGHILRRKNETESFRDDIHIEHFGYADGLSQPLFMKDDIASQRSTKHWDDAEPLNLVLAPDPNGKGPASYGSFLVFRKLEQNVDAFVKAEKALGKIKDAEGRVNDELPGAMLVGRFRNGNVVVNSDGMTGAITRSNQISNDFDYSNDPPPTPSETPAYSGKCPFFAHTRLTNPRADITIAPSAFVHAVRITRRSSVYQDDCRFGKGNENLTDVTEEQLNANLPSKGVGLLFMSYQANIGKQFEFLQNNWSNHGHIAGRNVGPDGVVGQLGPVPRTGLAFKPGTPNFLPRKMPTQWGEPVPGSAPDISFGQFVKNLGAEYFFTPSISFLQGINSAKG